MAKKKKATAKKARPAGKTPPNAAPKKSAPVKRTRRSSWLDEASNRPVIERYARQLKSFIQAMADGRIVESEVKDQEKRLVRLMKEIEPHLDEALHEKVTQLLCELTAYDLMQMLHAMQQSRPKSVFRG